MDYTTSPCFARLGAAGGKIHPAVLVTYTDGRKVVMPRCGCPGTNNGRNQLRLVHAPAATCRDGIARAARAAERNEASA